MDKARRDALRRVRVAFHKYTECVYVSGSGIDTREEFEDTYAANKNKPVPTYDEMKEQIFTKLIEEKFRFVQVAPCRANCVIRIYRKEMDVNGKPGGVCGAVCFARNLLGQWTTVDRDGKEQKMDYDDAYAAEYWTSLVTQYPELVKASYYDVYLKVISF